MTSTTFSSNRSDDKKPRRVGCHNSFFVPALYQNELRRTWATGLLFAIILFFAIPVVLLIHYTSGDGYFDSPSVETAHFLREYISGQNPFVMIYAILGALTCSGVVMDYLFDRRKTNFVCSLPVKRGAYLITKTASSFTWSILAWVPAVILSVTVTAATPLIRPYMGVMLSGLFSMVGIWLCYFLYFFGLLLLASCFCGTHAMSGLMMIMLGGYIPLTALSLISYIELFLEEFWGSYFMSYAFFDAISGVFRIAHYCTSKMSIFFYLGTALLGILFIAIAVFFTVKRKSENAGVPFAFVRAREIVKYLLIALSSLLLGMLFYLITGEENWGIVWLIFGIVCGALLSWMLCNTLFYKTPKMMFEGRRGVLVTAIVMAVFSLLLCFDVLSFNGYVPSDAMTGKVELHMGDTEIKLSDKKLIRLYNAMVRNGYKVVHSDEEVWFGSSDPTYKKTDFSDENAVRSFQSVWYTNYLLPVPKCTYARETDYATFVKELTAHADFADMYTAASLSLLDDAEAKKVPDINVSYSESIYDASPLTETRHYTSKRIATADVRKILETHRDEIRALGADALQAQHSGSITFYFLDDSVTVPLYVTLEKTRYAILDSLQKGSEGQTANVYQTERSVITAQLYKNGEVIGELSEDEVVSLFDAGIISFDNNNSNIPFTLFDPDYDIRLTCKERQYTDSYDSDNKYEDTENGEPAIDDVTEEDIVAGNVDMPDKDVDTYEKNFTCRFFLDTVPSEYLD